VDISNALFRWIHILAGIIWIGMLYFFNWVNGPFAATMDGDTKKKVVPQLMPRALFWFRWGAAWTGLTGILLLGMVFYSDKNLMFGPEGDWSAAEWHLGRLRALGEEIAPARLSRFGEFVRRWSFSPITKPFLQEDSGAKRFPSLAAEDLQRIEELALAALPISFPGPHVDFKVGCPERPSRILAYAVREVHAETARTVKILCGSDDTIRIWLNGKPIHSNWILRGADPDQDETRAGLEAGRNVLTVEVGQGRGNWGLYFRFEDLSGRKLRLTDEGKLEPLD